MAYLKVIIVEETEYEDQVECKHSYNQRCHTTYTTDFEPQQVIFFTNIKPDLDLSWIGLKKKSKTKY